MTENATGRTPRIGPDPLPDFLRQTLAAAPIDTALAVRRALAGTDPSGVAAVNDLVRHAQDCGYAAGWRDATGGDR